MPQQISAPTEWVEAISELTIPDKMNGRLQHLMDLNTEGQLSPEERDELSCLVELSERISLVRANALVLLQT